MAATLCTLTLKKWTPLSDNFLLPNAVNSDLIASSRAGHLLAFNFLNFSSHRRNLSPKLCLHRPNPAAQDVLGCCSDWGPSSTYPASLAGRRQISDLIRDGTLPTMMQSVWGPVGHPKTEFENGCGWVLAFGAVCWQALCMHVRAAACGRPCQPCCCRVLVFCHSLFGGSCMSSPPGLVTPTAQTERTRETQVSRCRGLVGI